MDAKCYTSWKIISEKGAWEMKIERLVLPEQNKIMQAYNNDKGFLHTYFDYENNQSSYGARLQELKERAFQRTELAATIHAFMEPFGISEKAAQHIKELENEAVAVIGGQQAGILTGPLYAVHKAITVIVQAKQQRQALGVPVIPVFWVAGEDHDLNEINHVYTEEDGTVSKTQIHDKFVLKLMASDATYDQQWMIDYVKDVFVKFGETAHTKTLLTDVLDAVSKEQTFTGFFVRLMNGLFAEEGLLFIDSAYERLRKLESDYFTQLIKRAEPIAQSIVHTEQQFNFQGYGLPIEAQVDAANLFYVHEVGRVLLTRRNGFYVNDHTGLKFTEEQLIQIAEETPELLSNNVATRPMMQDFLFPVLAFVGGPGEIAYWALLKEAFHTLDMKMPIIVPRMSMTLVSRRSAKILAECGFSVADVIAGKVATARNAFIDENRDERFVNAVNDVEEKLVNEYATLGDFLGEDEVMMQNLLVQNIAFHKTQFDYLKSKAEEALFIKHRVALRKLDAIEASIMPQGVLQERMYTPYDYLNSYGPTLIKDLLRLQYEVDGTHKVLYL